jgi:hypothetical protein
MRYLVAIEQWQHPGEPVFIAIELASASIHTWEAAVILSSIHFHL